MTSGWLGLDWGNVPTWIGATLTGSSLLVAARTYQRNVDEKRKEQVKRVTTWVPAPGSIVIKNANDGAVAATAHLDYGYQLAAFPRITLAPQEQRVLDVPLDDYQAYCDHFQLAGQTVAPSLLIVDSNGLSWLRDPRNALRQLDGPALESLTIRLEQESIPIPQ